MMSSFAARLGQLNTVQIIRKTLDTLFSRHLLITNTVITVSLSMTGDIMQQRYEVLCKRQKTWDRMRTLRVCGTALFIGPTCHYWYLLLDRVFPGTALRTIAKKIIVDQVIFSPINISMFLVLIGWFEGSTNKEIWYELKNDGPTLLKAEWIVWPPAQVVNFYFLPTKYRVLFDNTVSLGFDYYYSYVKFRKDKPRMGNSCNDIVTSGKQVDTISEDESQSVQEERVIRMMQHCNRAFRLS